MFEKDQFLKYISDSEKNTIALDFDGVIHKNSNGFFNGTIYDDPIDGAIKSIKEIKNKGYKIVIYTCKANSKRPLIDGKTGIQLVWEWLDKHGIKECIEDVVAEKPNALCYIDDKGIRFENWQKTMDIINESF